MCSAQAAHNELPEWNRHYASLLADYSAPAEGSKQLKFDTKYPKPFMTQFWAIFAKYMAAYWRMPEYN